MKEKILKGNDHISHYFIHSCVTNLENIFLATGECDIMIWEENRLKIILMIDIASEVLTLHKSCYSYHLFEKCML